MGTKKELPEELTVLIRRLVSQGQIRIAGTLLYAWFRREWQLRDDIAAYYMTRYFEKYHGDHLQKHRKRMVQ